MKNFIAIAFAFFGLLACDRDIIGPQETNPKPKPVLEGKHVFVVDEGNFGSGNASITAYNPSDEDVQYNVYSGFNDDVPLGDVLQDMQQYNGRYYLVLNNSGKVTVVDTTTWKNVGDIEGLINPRYISFYKNRAFVTELYAKKLWVLNLNQMKVEQEIVMPESGFHTIAWNNRIWVGSKQYLVSLNPETLEKDSTYTLRKNVERMVVDSKNRMWVLTTENPAHLYRFSQNGDIELDWTFGNNEKPLYLEINSKEQDLYFVMGTSVYRQNVDTLNLSPQKILDFSGQNIYGFNVNPVTGELYLADALDYNQASDIYRYSATGQLIDQFKSGVISNGFLFN
ncbi:YncE family protein [Owenweeksia hongkongensis]|uniref:YncE family protein n=1 Tax=Owenweeksia hongkongensis TaxID=253245 RepID=UPI003A903C85